jgi:outer membrane PBP1 activator LpoA protein
MNEQDEIAALKKMINEMKNNEQIDAIFIKQKSQEISELKSKLDFAILTLRKINAYELNSQRPGGGRSVSATLSFEGLQKLGEIK